MTLINTNFKSVSNPPPSDAPVPDAGLAELRSRLEEAYAQLEEVDDKYLSEEQQHQKEYLMAKMKSAEALIDSAGINGSAAGADPADEGWTPQELEPGWNGIPPEFRSSDRFPDDAAIGNEDPAHYGTYIESLQIPDNGDPANPNTIGFQMTDDMVAIYAETHGRDIVVIVEYADGHREYSVLKEKTVSPQPLVFSARGLSHAVTIDAHKVFLVNEGNPNDPSYANQKIYITGSDYNDTLYGSQSRDKIVAGLGHDTIDGGAGEDSIWGDKYYERAGGPDSASGGNDLIRGGTGNDIIYGGGGADTTYTSDAGEQIAEARENAPIDDVLVDPPAAEDVLSPPPDGWKDVIEDEGGTIILRNNGEGDPIGGTIDLTMPDGFTMAYAEPESDSSLVITYVGEDGNGKPITFKVKIEDFFGGQFGGRNDPNGIIRLNFHGGAGNDIIDFSRITEESLSDGQIINITDEEGGDDIILGPRSKLIADGVDLDNILTSQGNSDGKLEGYVENGIYNTADGEPRGEDSALYNGFEATVENGQIVISKDSDPGTDTASELGLVVPAGYDHGYITTDGDSYYVVMVKTNPAAGEPNTIVFKIDSSTGLDPESIRVYTRQAAADNDEGGYVEVSITPISNTFDNIDDYFLNGGDGNDLVFAQRGYRTSEEDDGEVVEFGDNQVGAAPPRSNNNEDPPDAPDDAGGRDDGEADGGDNNGAGGGN